MRLHRGVNSVSAGYREKTPALKLHVMNKGFSMLSLFPFVFVKLNEMLICLSDDNELRVNYLSWWRVD